MAKKSNTPIQKTTLPSLLTQTTRTMYFFIAFFALSIVVFDSGNLLTKDAVVDRWILLTILFIINTVGWFVGSQLARLESLSIAVLAVSTIVFAGFMTYWERGMASTSTLLYMLPIAVIATLKNRHAIIATAALTAATYALASVKYFNDFFNEGYRIQLWGNIILYSGSMIVFAWFLLITAGLRKDSK